MVRVPEHITLGALDSGAREVGEVVVDLGGHTDDMSVVLDARHRIADMIARIRSELGR